MKTKRILLFTITLGAFALTVKLIYFRPREILFEDAIIYGKVKSIKEISYKAKLSDNKIIKLKRWRYAHLTNDFDCYFDPAGKITKRIIYPAKDTGFVHYIEIFKYNSKGLLIQKYSPGEKWRTEKFHYNNGKQIIRQERNLDYLKYKYYKSGKLKSKTYITPKNEKEFQYTYTYENGFIKHEDTYYFGAGWHLIDEYQRDENGNIIKHRIANSFPELKNEKWDEFEYEFDEYHNWTKCIHYRYKKPIYILERKLEYY